MEPVSSPSDLSDLVLEDMDGFDDKSWIATMRTSISSAPNSHLRVKRGSNSDLAPSQGMRASLRARASLRQHVRNAQAIEVWTDVMPSESQNQSPGVAVMRPGGLLALPLGGGPQMRRSGAMDFMDCNEAMIPGKRSSSGSLRRRAQSQTQAKPVFADAAAMKKRLREAILKPKYSVSDFYKTDGTFQFVARHPWFEAVTLVVIAINALYMAVDADHNKAELLSEADWYFQAAEHFFCVYFLMEWYIRFMAFEVKANGFKDAWFVFDTGLMVLSVVETWIISLSMGMIASDHSNVLPTPLLRVLRLLRLARMARMARILKELPELMILIKGMSMAMRSVLFTCCLLIILIYVFAIGFTGLLRNTEAGQLHFDTVVSSMVTLALYGTLLDEITSVAYPVGEESTLCAFLLGFFILLAALTVMNMLIGVLCEVVNAVAAVERDELVVNGLHAQLKQLFDDQGLNMNDDGRIDRKGFEKLLEIPQAARALQDVGVDVVGLVDLADVIFEGNPYDDEPEKQLSFAAFMGVVLQLRGGNTATVKDIVDIRKSIMQQNERLVDNLHQSIIDSGMLAVDHFVETPSHSEKLEGFRTHKHDRDGDVLPQGITISTIDSETQHPRQSPSEDTVSRAAPVTLNIPQDVEDTGGTKDLRSVEDLLTDGLQELQRIQARSLTLDESLSADLSELRGLLRRTEGLQEVFVHGLNEVSRAR